MTLYRHSYTTGAASLRKTQICGEAIWKNSAREAAQATAPTMMNRPLIKTTSSCLESPEGDRQRERERDKSGKREGASEEEEGAWQRGRRVEGRRTDLASGSLGGRLQSSGAGCSPVEAEKDSEQRTLAGRHIDCASAKLTKSKKGKKTRFHRHPGQSPVFSQCPCPPHPPSMSK